MFANAMTRSWALQLFSMLFVFEICYHFLTQNNNAPQKLEKGINSIEEMN